MLRIEEFQEKQKFSEKTEKTKNVPNYKISSVKFSESSVIENENFLALMTSLPFTEVFRLTLKLENFLKQWLQWSNAFQTSNGLDSRLLKTKSFSMVCTIASLFKSQKEPLISL